MHAAPEPTPPAHPSQAHRAFVAVLGVAIAAAVAVKAAFSLWLLDHCESAAAWHYLCADIEPWARFLEQARSGAVPYVDFAREYPTGAGTLFWALGAAFDAQGFDGALRLQVGLSFVADLACALLLYLASRRHGSLRACGAALAWLSLPCVTVLSPVRFESTVSACLLLGYLLWSRGKPLHATGWWALGATLKWYPAIGIAAAWLARPAPAAGAAPPSASAWRRLLPQAVLVAAVFAAANLPFMLGDLARHGHVAHWLSTYVFHAERRLAPDTILGVLSLWLGELPFERHASLLSMSLAGIVMLTRRELDWPTKVALTCIALLLLNRIYSPQFNLWLYPPALLAAVARPRLGLIGLMALLALLDVLTVGIFPFLYAGVVDELGGFDWGAAPWYGGPYTEQFTVWVLLRGFVLAGLAALLLHRGDAEATT